MSGIAATIVAVVALPLNIIGLAIPFWDYYGTFLGSSYSGLWQGCFNIGGQSVCGAFGGRLSLFTCFDTTDEKGIILFYRDSKFY